MELFGHRAFRALPLTDLDAAGAVGADARIRVERPGPTLHRLR